MAGKEASPGERWHERFPIAPARPWIAPAAALGLVALALLLRIAIRPWAPTGLPFLFFFPAVMLTAFLFGVRTAVAAAGFSLLLAWTLLIGDPMRPGVFVAILPAVVPFVVLAGFTLWLFHLMQQTNAMLRRERARSAALAETREALFRELQHRVSNNLQVAAGLLVLQKRHVTDANARAAVDEAARRIGMIGRVSRQLYAADGKARAMQDFLAPLCADAVEMSGRDGITVAVQGDGDVMLAPDAALPVALIVAEAVANAIEHGFAARSGGRIDVVHARDGEGMLTVEVRDDGCGLPDGFAMAEAAGLGLGIARTLAEQLGGSFTLERGERTVARLTLPA
ncbi:sensor histidine kinase [Sphingomonas canadensis]|uniref:histidine kinase n=1 Tax=Sphingomonas canadensis TaxID=1219257 RepID=A0ABW3H216_9SPHN|nr:sensor histidine kinase [Sphingomonas canadensis]MCW3834584.1 sensor histidine kinase [Sphingomonas canadensis]